MHLTRLPYAPVNLTQIARKGIPVTPTWLQRVFPSLNYQPHAASPRPSGDAA